MSKHTVGLVVPLTTTDSVPSLRAPEGPVQLHTAEHLAGRHAAEVARPRAALVEALGYVYAKPEDISVERYAALCAIAKEGQLPPEVAAKVAEADRLRKLFDDAGQGEHNVLALIDHYQRSSMDADERLRAVRRLLEENGCECPCDHHPDERGPDCEVCLACRIGEAVGK
jgi:hypothetical protein